MLSCSNDNEPDGLNTDDQDLYISAKIGTLSLPANLKCDLHIFWKSSSETEYSYKETVSLTGDQTKMRFLNKDLKDKNYRFLFVATSSATPEISITNKSNNALSTSDKWTDVLITSVNQLISSENYSGILDKTGSDILDGGTIHGTLTRMVGQIVLDLFRINGTITNPTAIVSPDVESVLDRVYKIDIEYTNMTESVVFDTTNKLFNNDFWAGKYTQSFNISTDSDLKVSIPQPTNGLEESPVNVDGSVRIKGLYCLPSTNNLTLKYTFHYYDTTPKCENNNHQHTSDCFITKTVVVNLPKDNLSTPLNVFPNYFTVNKGGIKFDRIIDVGANITFEFDTVWKNDINP